MNFEQQPSNEAHNRTTHCIALLVRHSPLLRHSPHATPAVRRDRLRRKHPIVLRIMFLLLDSNRHVRTEKSCYNRRRATVGCTLLVKRLLVLGFLRLGPSRLMTEIGRVNQLSPDIPRSLNDELHAVSMYVGIQLLGEIQGFLCISVITHTRGWPAACHVKKPNTIQDGSM